LSRFGGVRAARRNPERSEGPLAPTLNSQSQTLAGPLGFEPRQSAPKALDLPLVDGPTLFSSRAPPQAALPSPQVRAIQRSPFGSPGFPVPAIPQTYHESTAQHSFLQGLRRKRLCPRLRFARYSAHHSAHPVFLFRRFLRPTMSRRPNPARSRRFRAIPAILLVPMSRCPDVPIPR
jgi:hypothetical protein